MLVGPGSTVGPFKIQSLLGKGGMGEVFSALDTRLDRKVALKILPSDFASDSERLRRFQTEAKTLASINHPNILVIHEVGAENGNPYLVSELLEGRTLREELSAGALPLRKALDYALQITRGLAAAHARGIIHRDLKPENIFITKDNRVKILDFGLAKPSAGIPPDKLSPRPAGPDAGVSSEAPTLLQSTVPGLILGTPAYMSPEQIRGESADQRSDIFAFGCVLYEILVRRPPFRRDTAVASMNAILTEEATPLSTAAPDTSAAMERIVHRCLEKEPSRRFQSVDDLAFALEGLSNASTSTLASAIGPAARPRFPRALAWTIPAFAIGAALGIFFRGTLFTPEKAKEPAPRPVLRKIEIRIPPPTRKGMAPGVGGLSISPDGRKLAYLDADGLWLRRLDQQGPPLLLAPGDTLSYPFWSPNSAEVAWFEESTLKRIPVTGGHSSIIWRLPHEVKFGGASGAWLENDEIIFTCDFLQPFPAFGDAGLHRVSANGGEPTLVLPIAKDEQSYDFVGGLPGGAIVFVVRRTNTEVDPFPPSDRIAVWNPKDGPRSKRVVLQHKGSQFARPVYSSSGHLIFRDIREGKEVGNWALPFSLSTLEPAANPVRLLTDGNIGGVSADGTLALGLGSIIGTWYAPRQLVWVDRSGKVSAPIGAPHKALSTPRLSPDGRFVAFAAEENATPTRIWTFDLSTGALLPLASEGGPFHQVLPFWLPNGREIALTAGRSAIIAPVEGAGTNRIIADDLLLHLSLSGQYAFFRHRSRGSITNYYLHLSTEPPQSVLLPAASFNLLNRYVYRPNLSPDDSTLAFESDESGRSEIWTVAFPAFTNRVMVSRGGGIAPQWSRDGKELFYLTDDTRGLMAAAVLDLQQRQFGAPVKLFDIPASIYVGESFNRSGVFDVSADRQRFLMMYNAPAPNSSSPEVGTTVLLVENWFEEYRETK